MADTLPMPPARRFNAIIAALCGTLADGAARHPAAAPLLLHLLWPRLLRLVHRFLTLTARVAAGTAPRPPATPRPDRPARPHPPYQRLPQGFGWLARLLPEGRLAGSRLQHLLAAPDMAELVGSDPHFARMLRPLCRMLGVRPPPLLAPPPRPAPSPPRRPVRRPAPRPQAPAPSAAAPPDAPAIARRHRSPAAP